MNFSENFKINLLVFIAFIAFANFSIASNQISNERKYRDFENEEMRILRSELTTEATAIAMSKSYLKLFHVAEKLPMNVLSSNDLDWRFRAASKAAFYTNNTEYVIEMRNVFDQLVKSKRIQQQHFNTMYTAYIGARMIDEAKQFILRYPSRSVIPLPEFKQASNLTANAPTEWVLSRNERVVTLQSFELPKGPFIVLVSHPNCHFSANAAEAISLDNEIMPMLKGHIKLLAPQDRNFEFDTFNNWNKEYPDLPMSVAYRRTDWSDIDLWETPVFYFYLDGVLKNKLVGWPKSGNKKELQKNMRLIGL